MKKVIFIIVTLSIVLCSCTIKHVTIEQSVENFNNFKNSLNTVVNSYGFVLYEVNNENISDTDSYKDLLISMNDKSEIIINMLNTGYDEKKGTQTFDVQYSIDENDVFDVELFVDIVNVLSGKTITEELAKEFLNASEKKYSASRYGISKTNEQKILKHEFLNFGEDWSISYALNTDATQVLSFSGLTK